MFYLARLATFCSTRRVRGPACGPGARAGRCDRHVLAIARCDACNAVTTGDQSAPQPDAILAPGLSKGMGHPPATLRSTLPLVRRQWRLDTRGGAPDNPSLQWKGPRREHARRCRCSLACALRPSLPSGACARVGASPSLRGIGRKLIEQRQGKAATDGGWSGRLVALGG